MKPQDVVRQNPRLVPHVTDVMQGLAHVLEHAPNARILWVEEYARVVVGRAAHRAGIAAITQDGVVLTWKHGAMYRKRSAHVIVGSSVREWELVGGDRLRVVTDDGSGADVVVSIEFRRGSPEYEGFAERFTLIRPFGR